MKIPTILLALAAIGGVLATEPPPKDSYNPPKPPHHPPKPPHEPPKPPHYPPPKPPHHPQKPPHYPHKPNKCNADNCLRGVRGTAYGLKPPLATRLADCKKYQVVVVKIVEPDVTKTKTVTKTIHPHYPKRPKYPPPKKHYNRDAEAEAEPEPFAEPEPLEERGYHWGPKHVPAYATYCPSPERYASACECVGYKPETKTVHIPGKTIKVVVTETVKAPKPKPTKHHPKPPKYHPKPPKHHPKPPKYDPKPPKYEPPPKDY